MEKIEFDPLIIIGAFNVHLRQIFPNVTTYVSLAPTLRFPNFFTRILTTNRNDINKKFIRLDYFISSEYNHQQNPQANLQLLPILNDISAQMLLNVEAIEYRHAKIWINNARTETVDNVLHYFANISAVLEREQIGEFMKELNLDVDGKFKAREQN